MKNIGLPFKLGIFVLIGLIALGYLTIKITKYKRLLVMKGYEIHAIFDDASGIKANNSVSMAGVGIGRVKEILLTKGGKADVVMLIKPHVRIAKDAEARIRGHGMVGTKFVEIVQGISSETVKPHKVVTNTTSASNIDEIINDANLTLNHINDYLESEKESLKQTTEHLKETSSNMNDVLDKINKGQGTLGKLINDDALYSKFKDGVDRLDNIIAKIEKGQGTLGKLINDEDFYNEARDTIDQINEIVSDIQKGKGTLGKLVKDETLYDDVKDVLRDIKKTSEVVKEQTPMSTIGTAVGIAR
jgi:phospholipid/cholesterol/gamma-HCH transport system substrate-binding protein